MKKYFLYKEFNLLLIISYMTLIRLLFSGSITDCYSFDLPVVKILSDSYLYDLDNNLKIYSHCFNDPIRILSYSYLYDLDNNLITDYYCFKEPILKILSDSYLYDLDNNLINIKYGPENKLYFFSFLHLFRFFGLCDSFLSEYQQKRIDYFVQYMYYYFPKDIEKDYFKILTIIQAHSHSNSDIDKHMVRNCYHLLVYLKLLYYIPSANEQFFTFKEALNVIKTMEILRLANLLQIVMEQEVSINNNYYLSFKKINLFLLYKNPDQFLKY